VVKVTVNDTLKLIISRRVISIKSFEQRCLKHTTLSTDVLDGILDDNICNYFGKTCNCKLTSVMLNGGLFMLQKELPV